MDADYLRDRLRSDCGLTAVELQELISSGLLSREDLRRARGLLVVETGVVDYFPGLTAYEGKTPGGVRFGGFERRGVRVTDRCPRLRTPSGERCPSGNTTLRGYALVETLLGFPLGWTDITKDDV